SVARPSQGAALVAARGRTVRPGCPAPEGSALDRASLQCHPAGRLPATTPRCRLRAGAQQPRPPPLELARKITRAGGLATGKVLILRACEDGSRRFDTAVGRSGRQKE